MLAGFVIVPVVSVITPKPDKKFLDDAFSCYTKTVVVRQSKALGDAE